jgi:hypothetical protein
VVQIEALDIMVVQVAVDIMAELLVLVQPDKDIMVVQEQQILAAVAVVLAL